MLYYYTIRESKKGNQDKIVLQHSHIVTLSGTHFAFTKII